MNNLRRQQLRDAIARINIHVSVLQTMLAQEKAALSTLPSSPQESESVDCIQHAIDNLEAVLAAVPLDHIRLL